MISEQPRANLLVSGATLVFCASAGLYSLMRLAIDTLFTTHITWRQTWQQGDWLINRELAETRRGHIGSGIIELADLLSVSPLVITFVFQIGLTLLAFALLFHLFLGARQPLLLALFMVSPGLFVVFWAADGQAAFRKEILSYVAILLTLSAGVSGRVLHLVFSAVIFCIGVYGHEANILFLPLFLAVLWMFRAKFEQKASVWLSAAIAILGPLHAFWYAYTYRHLEETALVCDPLLQRGIGPEICDGAIQWLSIGLEQSGAFILSNYVTLTGLATFTLIYALILGPVLFAVNHLEKRGPVALLLLLSALPFVLLFPIATDWGRWISMHVFSMLILFMAVLYSGYSRVQRQPDPKTVMILMTVSLCWAPNHMLGIEWFWPAGIIEALSEAFG